MQVATFIYISPCKTRVLKVKEPSGCLLVELFILVTRFPMPQEPSLGIMALSPATSQLHIHWVAQLILTPQVIRLVRFKLSLQTFACFEPLIIYTILEGPHML